MPTAPGNVQDFLTQRDDGIVNIVLCGFMGCGKSSVGFRLARLTGYRFVDMDREIEQHMGMSVKEIFERYGEKEFRMAETRVAKALSQKNKLVIATGGGTVMNPENVEAIHSGGGTIFFLDVPVAALQERLKRDKRRPLLQRPDRREFIEALYKERCPKYLAAADIVVKAGAPAVVVARKMAAMAKALSQK